MNIHAAAFLLGCLPAQRCGAVYCHALKSLRLDVVLTSFHMQLSRSSRPDIVWALPPMLVTLDVPACCPADLEVEEKEAYWWPWRSSVLPSRLHCAESGLVLQGALGLIPREVDSFFTNRFHENQVEIRERFAAVRLPRNRQHYLPQVTFTVQECMGRWLLI